MTGIDRLRTFAKASGNCSIWPNKHRSQIATRRFLAFLKHAHSVYCCTLLVSEASAGLEIGNSLLTVPNRYDVFAILSSLSKVSWAPFRWLHHQSTLRTTCPTNPTDNQGAEITVPSETTTVYASLECRNFFARLQIDDR